MRRLLLLALRVAVIVVQHQQRTLHRPAPRRQRLEHGVRQAQHPSVLRPRPEQAVGDRGVGLVAGVARQPEIGVKGTEGGHNVFNARELGEEERGVRRGQRRGNGVAGAFFAEEHTPGVTAEFDVSVDLHVQ